MTSVQLIRTQKWRILMDTESLKLNRFGQILVRGKNRNKDTLFQQNSSIRIMERITGRVVEETMSACKHRYSSIIEHPMDPNVILEACMDRMVIRAYDMYTKKVTTVNAGHPFRLLCLGPNCNLLTVDDVDGTIFNLMWDERAKYFQVRHLFQTNNEYITAMSYDKKLDILAIISDFPNYIQGVMLRDGLPLWRISPPIQDRGILSSGLCWDTNGRIYVADTTKVLVLNGQTGKVLDRFDEETLQPFIDVCFSPLESELVMLHGNKLADLTISCFKTLDNV